MGKSNSKGSKQILPNAPLVEVVFELRWMLRGEKGAPPPMQNDPGYSILEANFIDKAKKYGLDIVRHMNPEGFTIGHSVAVRLYKKENENFPLWQVGPGIFASNESSNYEWGQFKKFTLDGIKEILTSYPKVKGLEFTPIHLELRYIDSFDMSLLGYNNPVKFISDNTSFKISIPSFLERDIFEIPKGINIQFNQPTLNLKHSNLSFRIGNGTRNERECVILQTQVITKSTPVFVQKTTQARLRFIDKWLEDAHDILSEFFKEFVTASLMETFTRKPDDIQ